MNNAAKTLAVLAVAALALTGCNTDRENREKAQKTSQITNSLEKQNLEKKRDKEEDPNTTRYLYLMSFGQPIGYYVTKGKVSSNGSQIGPETEIITGGGNGNVMDSAKDDGTYGVGDPGIFFFTADGTMVETNLDYIQSDQPLPVNVPLLRK